MTQPRTDERAFLVFANDDAHWTIQLADTKASVLMAASPILAGLLVPQLIPSCNTLARYVLFLAVGLALLSAAVTLMTLFPRTTPVLPSSLVYFFAIKQFENGADYFARVQGLTPSDTDRELAQQTWELARTQDRKFFWLRWGFRLFGLCLVASFIRVVWTHLPCS